MFSRTSEGALRVNPPRRCLTSHRENAPTIRNTGFKPSMAVWSPAVWGRVKDLGQRPLPPITLSSAARNAVGNSFPDSDLPGFLALNPTLAYPGKSLCRSVLQPLLDVRA